MFDPRIPHGVREVTGTHDPREGRLVIHGWFVQPRPFVRGPLRVHALAARIDELTDGARRLARRPADRGRARARVHGRSRAARVRDVRVLSDTTRVPRSDERDAPRVDPPDPRAIAAWRFGAQRARVR